MPQSSRRHLLDIVSVTLHMNNGYEEWGSGWMSVSWAPLFHNLTMSVITVKSCNGQCSRNTTHFRGLGVLHRLDSLSLSLSFSWSHCITSRKLRKAQILISKVNYLRG